MASGQATVAAAPPSVVINSRRPMEPPHSERTLPPACECSKRSGQRPPRYEPTSFVESDAVPTDGTRLPSLLNRRFRRVADFWATLRQAVRLTVRETYTS